MAERTRRSDEGKPSAGTPFTGNRGKLPPHPSAGGAADTFSLRAKNRLSGGCAPTRACGRSPTGEGQPVCSPLGPLCEGAPPAGGGGENCTAARNISGYGKVLSLRPFGAPLPPWRKRHLPRIGGVCLAEGGFSTRRGEMWLTSLLFAVTGRWKVQPFLHHHRI